MNKLSGKTIFTLLLICAPIVLILFIFSWTRESSLSISRKVKYTIVLGGAYISALTYSYSRMKKEKNE
ncbi:MAG: hypothetical protein ACI4Q5_10010 [Porcipelethomonas sp.]